MEAKKSFNATFMACGNTSKEIEGFYGQEFPNDGFSKAETAVNQDFAANGNANGMDSYSNAGGCGLLHPFNKKKKAECEAAVGEKREGRAEAKTGKTEIAKSKSCCFKTFNK